jgi:hypothetical protein
MSGRARFNNIRAHDREMVRAAARRSGISVSQWLDQVITQAAAEEDITSASAPQPEPRLGDSAIQAVHARIDELASKVERLAQHAARNPQHMSPQHTGDGPVQLLRLEQALNRLSDRLSACVFEPAEPSYQYPQVPGRAGLLTRFLGPRN